MSDPILTRLEQTMHALLERLPAPNLLQAMILKHLSTGGKRLRAQLAIDAAQCLELPTEFSMTWAAIVELFHNGTLIHDDVQDGDKVRRHQPTLWVQEGIPQAINAGDQLFLLPFVALSSVSPAIHCSADLLKVLSWRTSDVVRGQAMDVSCGRSIDLSWSDYETLVSLKTGALFQLAYEGPMYMASRSNSDIEAASQAASQIGIVFQMMDDYLDLFGNKGRQSIGQDLAEGKVSALVVYCLQQEPEQKSWLQSILEKPRHQTGLEEIQAIKAMLERIHVDRELLQISKDRYRRASQTLLDLGCISEKMHTKLQNILFAPS